MNIYTLIERHAMFVFVLFLALNNIFVYIFPIECIIVSMASQRGDVVNRPTFVQNLHNYGSMSGVDRYYAWRCSELLALDIL